MIELIKIGKIAHSKFKQYSWNKLLNWIYSPSIIIGAEKAHTNIWR
jgi:hypothetical protein